MTGLRYGGPAPDFSLPSTGGGTVTLSGLKGSDVVLVFYCYDFGSIWTPELSGLDQVAERVRQRGGVVLAVSADTTFCHAEFAKARGFSFPLLSDVHRATIRAYGVHDEDRNVAYRSTFIIDRDGALRWGQAGDRLMVRDGSEVLRVLDVLDSTRPPAPK